MYYELWRHRRVRKADSKGDPAETTASKYESTDEIIEAMGICIDCAETIKNLIEGLELDLFRNNGAVVDRCAINFQVIGNLLGRLDEPLQLNDAMRTAYDSRVRIAHDYKTRKYDVSILWGDLNNDIDSIIDGCERVKSIVSDKSNTIVFSHNIK